MKIRDVTFTLLRHALDARYGDAQGLKTHRSSLIVRIDTDDGPTGWGDISNSRDDTNTVHLRQARDRLIGQDPLASGPLIARLAGAGPRIAAGIDVALADIRGQAAGMSLATLLGGAHRAAQPCYASLQNASDTPDVAAHAVAEAQQALVLGFRHIKMKVGFHPVELDIEWIEAVLDALPGGMRLAIDANRALDRHDALRLIRGLRHPDRIAWFEEPCGNRIPELYRELRASLPVPIAGGETIPVGTLEQVIAGRMMDIVQPDLISHGGFAPMQHLFALCDAAGVRLIPHCFDGQLMRVATLHLLAARPDWEERHGEYAAAPLELDISPNPIRDELLGAPLRPDHNGCVPVPTAPGLGVSVNQDYLRRAGVPVPL